MLDASDALRAHAQCKTKLADVLKRRIYHNPYYCELAPDHDCMLVRFIRENDGAPGLEPELTQVKAAHATVHTAAIGLAQKRASGDPINLEHEFAPSSNFGAASAALVAAIWKLEKKLHSMAG